MHPETTSPLVSAEWLAERLDSPEIVVLDATFFLPNQGRNAEQEYQAAHIPGARFFDIDVVADRTNPLPHMLPLESSFADAVGSMGIGHHTCVVVYDRNSFMASARAWWMFRVFGHDLIYVLDGGLARWHALGLPTRPGKEAATPQPFTATYHPALVRELDDMLDMLGHPDAQIVDARSPGRFSGQEREPRPGLRSGHIPGSRNLFFKRLIDENSQCLKPVADLERAFREAGIDPHSPVTATCGSGVTAAILALGLYGLGNEYAAVYDGSWSEWGQREETPIGTG